MNLTIHLFNEQNMQYETHEESDLPIFNWKIIHKEAGFARLQITTLAPTDKICAYPIIKFYLNEKLFFYGTLDCVPIDNSSEIIVLNYMARPQNYHEQITGMILKLKTESNPLFVGHKNELIDLMESTPQLIEWDRSSHQARLCSIFAHDPINIQNIFYDSMRLNVTRKPYASVSIEVHASWQQRFEQVHDVSAKITQSFPEGKISTLTGKSFMQNWWKIGEACKAKQYSVINSRLEECNIHNEHSDLKVQDAIFKCPNNKILKKYFFNPFLSLYWEYKQSRHEIFKFTLKQGATSIPSRATKKIVLHLNDIIGTTQVWQPAQFYEENQKVIFNNSVWSAIRSHTTDEKFDKKLWQLSGQYHTNKQAHLGYFFKSNRGKKAAEHALRIAHTHLSSSARGIDLNFTCPLSDAMDIDTTTSIAVCDGRGIKTQYVGKVKQYSFEVNGETGEAIACIRLAICIAENINGDNLKFRSFRQESPSVGIEDPTELSCDDIVESVDLINTSLAQQDLITKNSSQEAVTVLTQCQSKLAIQLKDLQPSYPYQTVIYGEI